MLTPCRKALGSCRGLSMNAYHQGGWSWEDVEQETWRLATLDGQGILDLARPTLNFLPDGAVRGESGVNAYFGIYVRGGGAGLSISKLGTTRRAGPPELMAQEQMFLKELGAVDSWRVVSETLELQRVGRTVLTFVRAAE